MKLNPEQVMLDYNEGSSARKATIRYNLGLLSGQHLTTTFLTEWLAKHKEADLEYDFSWKGPRPWDIVNVTSRLDPKQIWIGYEFETGFDDKERFERAVNWLWNNADNFVIDREGCGDYPCEFTFSPVNLDHFMSSDYIIDKFLNKLNKMGETDRIDDGFDQIGMHVNFSGPNIRITKDTGKLADLLSCSIGALDVMQQRELFGRIPYGFVYARGDNNSRWLEGKLFDSTHNKEKWQAYKAVSNNLALLGDSLAGDTALMESIDTDDGWSDFTEDGGATNKIIGNIYEILMGNEHVGDAQLVDNPEYEGNDEDEDLF